MPTPRAEAPVAGVPHVPSAEVSEAPRPQSTPVEAAPALKETVAAKEAAAPVEAVAPQVPAELVVEASAPAMEASTPEAVSPASKATVSESAGVPATGEATVYGESEIVPPTQAMPEAVRPARAGWFARLRGGLARTRSQLGSIFSRNRIDETLYEELETALLASDNGLWHDDVAAG